MNGDCVRRRFSRLAYGAPKGRLGYGLRPGVRRAPRAWGATTARFVPAAAGLALACSSSSKTTGPTGKLQSIAITPGSASVAIGGSQKFTAVAKDANGNTVANVTFFWSTNNNAVATVTQGGQATGVDTGQVRVAASAEGVSGLATLTVTNKPVGSIVIAPSSATLRVATTLQLSDTVKDASGHVLSGAQVTWSSDAPAVVSVDGNGLVTARALGTAHISAASGGKTGTATITVSSVPVASVTIAPAAPAVVVGQTAQLSATTKDSAGNILSGRVVRWSSQTLAIATVDSIAGVLTGVSPGTSQITATSEGVSANVTATVSTPPANSVVLSPNVAQVHIGQTTTVTAVVTDASGNPITPPPVVTFSSNATTIASISSQSGQSAQVLAGPNSGTATITGTTGAKSGTATFIVAQVGVDSVNVTAPRDTLIAGQSENATAIPYDSSGNQLTGRPVTWKSSNTAVASVNGSGAITANAPGIAVIFATVSGISGSLAIVVNPVPVGSVTISPSTDTVAVGAQLQLTATVKDQNGNVIVVPVTWYSLNQSVAFVSSSGVVLGVAPGTATITDSAGGKGGTNTTVVVAPVASVVVYPTPDTIFATAPNNTVQLHDSTKDSNGNNLGQPVTWSPTSGGVATVNSSGLVTATNAAAGQATITATSSNGKSANGTVVVLGHSHAIGLTVGSLTLSASGTGDPSQTKDSAAVTDTFGNSVEASRRIVWTTSDPSTVQINGSASGSVNGTAGAAVTLTAVSSASSQVIITATAVDSAAVNKADTITVNP